MKSSIKVIIMGLILGSAAVFASEKDDIDQSEGGVKSENSVNMSEVEAILQRELSCYKDNEKLKDDLSLLENVKTQKYEEGVFFSVFMDKVEYRLKEFNAFNNIRKILQFVSNFIGVKKQLEGGDGYKKNLEEIYQDHGASNTEEEEFYESIVFLKQVRHLIEYELLEGLDESLKGVFFWEGDKL